MGAIKCLKCGKVMESHHRHDFNMCECDNETFVDGGVDYLRFGGMDMEYIQVLESCQKCGQRLDNKTTIIYAHEGKPWELCEKCYSRMKGEGR